jgi:hypothetical protein
MKKLYRAPLDYLEEVTTGMADTVFVNSGFTKEVTVIFPDRDVMVPKFIMSDPGPKFQMIQYHTADYFLCSDFCMKCCGSESGNPVPFELRDPKWIFFRISDPQPIFLRAWRQLIL